MVRAGPSRCDESLLTTALFGDLFMRFNGPAIHSHLLQSVSVTQTRRKSTGWEKFSGSVKSVANGEM
jgi:hypothetical protein